ncbi:hypothetical protein PBI_JEANIE_1 [Gordonia phage Jeanie]|uniref:Uncharacterized protein n=2 Tax=root TaxID=1 RepID=A0A160DHI5_9CAUD|nr:hypothetical protein [Gordonia neofelifaecis]YP_009274013.1 terminase small subunit [Gordonia phage McGonagall]ANA87579.1 hypothetical protein MCGONAGALL_1 [Gordonia phage McGonagall]ANA87606.1 hypothetical protein PBI_JEANIE_1 [Gordonia phage Jeanie]EGD53224.1 hypothetical protein SCNU_20092 [Gordonia neofelifaecis NRRL B-59395]
MSLFDADERLADVRVGQVLRGRHSKAMDAALTAANAAEVMGELDGGLATVLRAGAWALDSMEKSNHHYGPAKLIPAMTEALRDAHMTPESRQTDLDSDYRQLLAELASADDSAPVSDSAQ